MSFPQGGLSRSGACDDVRLAAPSLSAAFGIVDIYEKICRIPASHGGAGALWPCELWGCSDCPPINPQGLVQCHRHLLDADLVDDLEGALRSRANHVRRDQEV